MNQNIETDGVAIESKQESAPGQMTEELSRETHGVDYSTELASLRQKLASRESELESFKAREREREEAELSELEKLKKQLQESEQKFIESESRRLHLLKQSALITALRKNGALRPEFIAKTVDFNHITIENDTAVGVDSVVASLKNEAPELFGVAYTSAPGAVQTQQSDKAAAGENKKDSVLSSLLSSLNKTKNDSKNFI